MTDRFAKARETKAQNKTIRDATLKAIEPHVRAIQSGINKITEDAIRRRLCEVFDLEFQEFIEP